MCSTTIETSLEHATTTVLQVRTGQNAEHSGPANQGRECLGSSILRIDEEKEKEEQEETSSRSVLSWPRSSSTPAVSGLLCWYVGRPELPGIMVGVDVENSYMCYAGYDAPRVLFPSVFVRRRMLCILVGMEGSTQRAFVVDFGSGTYCAGSAGNVTYRAVFSSVVVRPKMLGIMAGMNQKGRYVEIVRWFRGAENCRFSAVAANQQGR